MKFVFSLFLSIFLTTHIWAADINIEQVRISFTKAVESEEITNSLLNQLEKVKNNNPLLLAYYGATQSLVAKHAWNPYTKMDYLAKSQATLQKAITLKPQDAEMRFLRFSIQYYVPRFLGYSKNLDEDKSVILKNIDRCPDDVRGVISRFLIDSGMCTPLEKKQLEIHAS